MSPLRECLLEFQIEKIINQKISAERKNIAKIGEVSGEESQLSKSFEEKKK
jgi:hypothetical protein